MSENIKTKINYKTLIKVLLFTAIPYVFFTIFFSIRLIEQFDIFLLLITSIFFVISIFGINFTFKFFPKVEIRNKHIIISTLTGSNVISLNNIRRIEISNISKYYGLLVNKNVIVFENGNKLELYPFKYLNFSEILISLNKLIEPKSSTIYESGCGIPIINKDFEYVKKAKTYNFYHFLSLTGITFYSLTFTIIFSFFSNKVYTNFNDTLLIIFIIVLIIIIFTPNMNYFILSQNNLLIKNSLLFWRVKSYDLASIQEIEIRKYRKQIGKVLLIKTSNFKNITCNSNNLNEKNWKLLINDLKEHNIKVTDLSYVSTQKIYY